MQSIPAVFDVIPVVTAQIVGGRGEHKLEDLTQYDPELQEFEHFVDPHWQAALLAVRPSFSLQYGTVRQELVDLSQYEPAAEHPLVPQIQIALFGSFPLIRVHSGADRQRQDMKEEHNVVEENNVL